MAIKIFDQFSPRANPGDTNYPNGSIKNESVPGAKDGTPLDAVWGNDYAGFDAALIAAAGLTPNGSADTAVASQRLQALQTIFDRTFASVSDLRARAASDILQVGQRIGTPATEWTVSASSTYALPYANRSRTFYALDIGGGLYAIPSGGRIYASDFLDEAVTATNDDAVGEISSVMRDGLKLDFVGKMYRVYANTTGIPSSGATPATDRAQLLTRMLFMDDLRDISFGAGGLYAANQSTAGAKNYFPSTLYLKQCQNVHFDAGSIFESKGESWGDADASVSLTFDQRQDFMGQNGGHAILAVRTKVITGSPTCRFAGSVGPLYFASCTQINLDSPFSNGASLGYASYSFDGWCGNIEETGFERLGGHITNPRGHRETILRREDGAQAGSSVYCGKGGIVSEDRNMLVTTSGGFIADMYANGSNKRLGYALGAGSGSIINSTGLTVRNCQEVIFVNHSVDEVSECNAYNVDAVVGLTGIMIDSQSFGDVSITLTGKVRINNSREWVGEVEQLATTSLIANLKPVSSVFVRLDVDAAGDTSPPSGSTGGIFSLINNNTVASYGGVWITGGKYETSGYLIRSVGWGSSQANRLTGLVIADGVQIRDINAAASDEYIKYTNKSPANTFTYIYHDLAGARFVIPNNFRRLDGYVEQGSGLVSKISLPQVLDDCYVSNAAYRRRQGLSLEWTSNTGLSGPNTLANFVIESNTSCRSGGLLQTNAASPIKVLGASVTIAGPQRVELLLPGDVRSQFTIITFYNYFGG